MQRTVGNPPTRIDKGDSTALHHREDLEPNPPIAHLTHRAAAGVAATGASSALYTALLSGAIVAGISLPQTPQGAPLDLADAPLFLGFAAPANIFFVIDDSGSMDFEVITRDFGRNQTFTADQPDGTSDAGAGLVTHRANPALKGGFCTFTSGTFQTTGGYIYGVQFASNTYPQNKKPNVCDIAADDEWRFRNADFNTLYYNPELDYKPWSGVDKKGNPFDNIDLHRAPDNPYDPQAFIDLTVQDGLLKTSPSGFRYYDWIDKDGDGFFDNGEEVPHLVKNEDFTTQTNFANWFSYYRKREYVAKAAYGQLIARTRGKRMGMATLHDNNKVKTAIQPILEEDPAQGNKRALLDNLYRINSEHDTPLPRAMDETGRYLECTSNPLFTSCPSLAEEEGGACQQNFMVVMTDGFYNVEFKYKSKANKDGDGDTTFDGGAYADKFENTLGDIAMNYYERDLFPAKSDAVVAIKGKDEAIHQHVSTYGVAFGVEGDLTAMPANPTDPFAWPNPFQPANIAAQNRARVDDLRHAAYNGRGGFLSAHAPDELIDALNRAFADVADRTGSAAAVAVNTTVLTTDTRVFQGRFDSSDWRGELLALPVGLDGTIGAPLWDAGRLINSQDFDAGREIITYSPDPTVHDGVPFRWVPSPPAGTTTGISAEQQTALNINPQTGTDDGMGEDRLNYLRGDRSNEGAKFRARSSVLADIVHSAPFFFGVSPFFYPDTLEAVPYTSFVLANKDRTPTVYVGANDGAMHGFNADTGEEVIAYVPGAVYPNLSKLTDPSYLHRYFVDGELSVVDAFVNGAWMSVLVGALGRGGQGIYALNVTDPGNFTEGNADDLALWEFTDLDDAELGYTFGRPTVVKMANGEWAAVFGNGYNNTDADGNASATGHAVLYIAFIEAGLDGSWEAGDVIKLDTQVGSPTTPNGLATPAPIDFNGDEAIDYIYAGDREGNLWKFDVTDPNPANWAIAYGGATPQPLFTALDPAGTPQPITTRPDVALHPGGLLGFVVYFTTGKYIETADNNNIGEPTQSVYGIWDKNEATLLAFNRSHLLQQQILSEFDAQFDTDGDGTPDSTEPVRTVSANPINWHGETGNPTGTPPTTHLGWYMDLVNCAVAPDGVTCTNTDNRGERAVTNPTLRTGRLIFETLIPSSNPCDFGGISFLMEVNTNTGGRLAFSVFDFNNDLFFTTADFVQVAYDVTGDGKVDKNDRVQVSGVGLEGISSSTVPLAGETGAPEIKLQTLSTGVVKPVKNNPGPGEEGRQSWRRLQ